MRYSVNKYFNLILAHIVLLWVLADYTCFYHTMQHFDMILHFSFCYVFCPGGTVLYAELEFFTFTLFAGHTTLTIGNDITSSNPCTKHPCSEWSLKMLILINIWICKNCWWQLSLNDFQMKVPFEYIYSSCSIMVICRLLRSWIRGLLERSCHVKRGALTNTDLWTGLQMIILPIFLMMKIHTHFKILSGGSYIPTF